MSRTTRYSIWARNFKSPKSKGGESRFEAAYRIARLFVGKTVWEAHVISCCGVGVKLRDKLVTITGIYQVALDGMEIKNGSTTTLYPNATFIGEAKRDDGTVMQGIYGAETLYETKELLAKDSKLMCGGYAEALTRNMNLVRYYARHLQGYLREYRDIANEFTKRGWTQMWKDRRLDAVIVRLMPIADDALITEVCDD